MRAKKLLGMAVVLVALAVTINALAYTNATVNNSFKLSIVSTGAALDIQPAAGADAGLGVSSASGYLEIDLVDDIQRNATYEWGDLFTITNNAQQAVDVWMVWGTAVPAGVTVLLEDTVLANPDMSFNSGSPIPFAKDDSRTYKLTITTTTGATLGNWTPTLELHGKK